MKKFYFLFLFALIASISNLYAAEKTVTWNFQQSEQLANGEICKDKVATTTGAVGAWTVNSTGETYVAGCGNQSLGSGIQFGSGKWIFSGSLALSGAEIPEGATVKKVSFFAASNGSNYTCSMSINGSGVGNTLKIGKKAAWKEYDFGAISAGAKGIVFNISGTSKNYLAIKSISITYEEVAETKCAKPTFSVEEGTYSEAQTITLAPGEGGEKVFYTINDGTEQQYIEPIKLEEEGTYKIAAYTAATETLAKSATVTKTYVINLPLEEPYILCKNAAWLTEGANIIFASSVAAGEQKAMSKLQKTKNRGAASVTIGSAFNAGKETVGIVSKDADVAVFTVGISNGHITFYTGDSKDEENNEVAGYLYAAGSGSGKNYLRTTKIVDPNAEWSVSVAANGAATIKAQGANTNNLMRYNPNNGNPGNPMFSCYGSGQEPVYIYLLGKTSSVSSMSVEGVKVFAAEGGVEVVADEAAEVAVYTAAGQLVRQARVAEGSTLVNVAPGFYVVRANGTATKVIVR